MSNILGLDGQPVRTEPTKRYAIVGHAHIHYAVFELKDGESEMEAVRTYNLMAQHHDPKLRTITTTEKFYWAEDDNTRPMARGKFIQQIYDFLAALLPDGTKRSEKEITGLVNELMPPE